MLLAVVVVAASCLQAALCQSHFSRGVSNSERGGAADFMSSPYTQRLDDFDLRFNCTPALPKPRQFDLRVDRRMRLRHVYNNKLSWLVRPRQTQHFGQDNLQLVGFSVDAGCERAGLARGSRLPADGAAFVAFVSSAACDTYRSVRAVRQLAGAADVFILFDTKRLGGGEPERPHPPELHVFVYEATDLAQRLYRLQQNRTCSASLQFRINSPEQFISRTSVLFVSVSFILLMIISLSWLVFYYVQRFRYLHAKERLTRRLGNAAKKALTKIPVKVLKPGDKDLPWIGDQCAVCIEPYRPSESVRILPCRHFYHKSCIDPWLLDQRTCPLCKLDILKAYGLQIRDRRSSHSSLLEGHLSHEPSQQSAEHQQQQQLQLLLLVLLYSWCCCWKLCSCQLTVATFNVTHQVVVELNSTTPVESVALEFRSSHAENNATLLSLSASDTGAVLLTVRLSALGHLLIGNDSGSGSSCVDNTTLSVSNATAGVADGSWHSVLLRTDCPAADTLTVGSRLRGCLANLSIDDNTPLQLANSSEVVNSSVAASGCIADPCVCANNASCLYSRWNRLAGCSCRQHTMGKLCELVDFCSRDANNCSGRGLCSNSPTGFSCSCSAHHFGRLCQHRDLCTAVHPCSRLHATNCTPSANGSYYCSCAQGYTGVNCTQLQPQQPQPADTATIVVVSLVAVVLAAAAVSGVIAARHLQQMRKDTGVYKPSDRELHCQYGLDMRNVLHPPNEERLI